METGVYQGRQWDAMVNEDRLAVWNDKRHSGRSFWFRECTLYLGIFNLQVMKPLYIYLVNTDIYQRKHANPRFINF